jgi:hypothetical protein
LRWQFEADEAASLHCTSAEYPATVTDISMSGVLLRSAAPAEPGHQVSVYLEQVGRVPARVVRRPDADTVALEMQTTSEQRELLIHKLFRDEYVRPIASGKILRVYRGVLLNAFG